MTEKPDKVPIEDQIAELLRVETEHSPIWRTRQGMDDREYDSRMRRLKAAIATLRWLERNRAKIAKVADLK